MRRRQRSQSDCPHSKKEQILTPTMYAYTRFGITYVGLDTQRPYHWSGDTVADMLENEIYLGNTVNMK